MQRPEDLLQHLLDAEATATDPSKEIIGEDDADFLSNIGQNSDILSLSPTKYEKGN